MQWWEEKAYARDEGFDEGFEEGIEEGSHKILLTQVERKLAKGKNAEEIAEALEQSEDVIRRLIAELESK